MPSQPPEAKRDLQVATQETKKVSPSVNPSPELEKQRVILVALSARAKSLHSFIAILRERQTAAGLSLRPDIDESEQLISTYLRAAESQLEAGDAQSTERSLKSAEQHIEGLEKVLRQ
jgi:hypothetical protein